LSAGVRTWVTTFLVCSVAAAADRDHEDFHVEFTAGAWLLNTTGTIQSGITPVDLESDLGIRDRAHFYGSVTLKPTRKNRLLVEGIPYRLDGDNTVSRQFVFGGRTYVFSDRVTSHADMDYVYGGYQRDLVSRDQGHFGLSLGVAYVDATGTVQSRNFGFTGVEHQRFPFPLVGAEFRVWAARVFNINGGAKGMSLGSYGHYVHGGINAGISLGRHVTLQAGYMVVDADVHEKAETRGIAPRMGGPVFSLQFRDR